MTLHPWSLPAGVLIALISGASLLSSFRVEPFRRWSWTGGQRAQVTAARSGHAAARPGRLFRRYDDVAPIPDVPNASTYERLWPGCHLPRWAQKSRGFQDAPAPPGPSMCFVHVGKTAGSSVGCALGFHLYCADADPLPGRLPRAVAHAFHKEVYDCPAATDAYLFVVRDPLARMRSAFVYGRDVENRKREGRHAAATDKIYAECPFFSIDELASLGLAEGGAASAECQRRARDMLRGTELYLEHAYYNYQYYLETIPHAADIVVVRTEHLAEDWKSIERGLGGAPAPYLVFPHANSRQKRARDALLGAAERRLLCRELCVEIQYYKLLLRRARNVNGTQYATSVAELGASCPREAGRKQCDVHTPNIRQKLLDVRGHRRKNETQR